jgi:hypothetical protein
MAAPFRGQRGGPAHARTYERDGIGRPSGDIDGATTARGRTDEGVEGWRIAAIEAADRYDEVAARL